MFKGIDTPLIFLQNVVTDLLLGLGMIDILKFFHTYIGKKYNAEAGFITMNMPKLVDELEKANIKNPIICTSINKAGFRMSGGKALYEKTLKEKRARIIAMQILAGGAISAKEAVEYVCKLPNIEAILFGASSKENILETCSRIREYDQLYNR
jgi:phosphoribosylformimino-5-aminoimidazole carboxamide ribonucleotide (ProFAR) isomerase